MSDEIESKTHDRMGAVETGFLRRRHPTAAILSDTHLNIYYHILGICRDHLTYIVPCRYFQSDRSIRMEFGRDPRVLRAALVSLQGRHLLQTVPIQCPYCSGTHLLVVGLRDKWKKWQRQMDENALKVGYCIKMSSFKSSLPEPKEPAPAPSQKNKTTKPKRSPAQRSLDRDHEDIRFAWRERWPRLPAPDPGVIGKWLQLAEARGVSPLAVIALVPEHAADPAAMVFGYLNGKYRISGDPPSWWDFAGRGGLKHISEQLTELLAGRKAG